MDIAVASDLLGWHGFRLRPRAAEALIVEKVPAMTEAQVECYRFPASCMIEVVERTPVLNWVTEGRNVLGRQLGYGFSRTIRPAPIYRSSPARCPFWMTHKPCYLWFKVQNH